MSRKTIDRRAILAIGAALPALATSQAFAVPSSWGAAPDPIHAAIEAHRQADAENDEAGNPCAVSAIRHGLAAPPIPAQGDFQPLVGGLV